MGLVRLLSLSYLLSSLSEQLTTLFLQDNLQIVRSPIEDSQSIKNPVELQGFRNAYLRDGLAWCKWSAWLEELIIKKKENINEWNAAVELTRFRESGEYFRGLSYENISATNENAGEFDISFQIVLELILMILI